MASSDPFYISVRGRQTHGAQPWAGVDPIVAAAGFDPRYFAAIDRVEIQAYVEDEALLVLSGPRAQSSSSAEQTSAT